MSLKYSSILFEELGQLPDVLLRHLQGLILGQLVIRPQPWQDPSQAIKALVQQIHSSTLPSICCQPPFLHHRIRDALVVADAHLAHLAALQGKSLGPLLHVLAGLLPLVVIQEGARPSVAEVDRAGDLLQGKQTVPDALPHLLQAVPTAGGAPVQSICAAARWGDEG